MPQHGLQKEPEKPCLALDGDLGPENLGFFSPTHRDRGLDRRGLGGGPSLCLEERQRPASLPLVRFASKARTRTWFLLCLVKSSHRP